MLWLPSAQGMSITVARATVSTPHILFIHLIFKLHSCKSCQWCRVLEAHGHGTGASLSAKSIVQPINHVANDQTWAPISLPGPKPPTRPQPRLTGPFWKPVCVWSGVVWWCRPCSRSNCCSLVLQLDSVVCST